MIDFNDNFQLTRAEYYKLESYRFNLMRFYANIPPSKLNEKQSIKIGQELTDMEFLLNILGKLLLDPLTQGNKVVIIYEDAIDFTMSYMYDVSCVEAASYISGIDDVVIGSICQQPYNKTVIKGYTFMYKKDFENLHITDPRIGF